MALDLVLSSTFLAKQFVNLPEIMPYKKAILFLSGAGRLRMKPLWAQIL